MIWIEVITWLKEWRNLVVIMSRSSLLIVLSMVSMTPWRSFSATVGLSLEKASRPRTTLGLAEVPSLRAAEVGASRVAPELT